jgi:hypothetical protein
MPKLWAGVCSRRANVNMRMMASSPTSKKDPTRAKYSVLCHRMSVCLCVVVSMAWFEHCWSNKGELTGAAGQETEQALQRYRIIQVNQKGSS